MKAEFVCPSCKEGGIVLPRNMKGNCPDCGHLLDMTKVLDEVEVRARIKLDKPRGVKVYNLDKRLKLKFFLTGSREGAYPWPVLLSFKGLLIVALGIAFFFWSGALELYTWYWFFILITVAGIMTFAFYIASSIRELEKVGRTEIVAYKDKLELLYPKHLGHEKKMYSYSLESGEILLSEISHFYVISFVAPAYGRKYFSLCAKNKFGEKVEIIPLIASMEIALFAKQELEMFYGLRS